MLEKICQLAREAGEAIMQVYTSAQPVDVTRKSDDSPVTAAGGGRRPGWRSRSGS